MPETRVREAGLFGVNIRPSVDKKRSVIKGGPHSAQPMQSSVRPGPSTSIAPPAGKPKPAQIIPKEHVDANARAREIVREAELAAQQMRKEAAADAEKTREQGYNDGYQEGLGAYTEQT